MATGLALAETERQTPKPMTLSLGAVSDRLGDHLLSLEKVDGTLATILDVGSEESCTAPLNFWTVC